MKKMKMYSKNFFLLSAMLSLMITISCEEIADAIADGADPIASFQFEVDETDFSMVSFTNFSQNATTYSWDFGGDGTSTDENPTHKFSEAGSYDVVLTASNAAGLSASKTETITITDPLEAQRTLVGDNGKVWQLIGDASTGVNAYDVFPANRSEIWWSLGGVDALCVRECIMDDTWTFNTDGTFTFENNGDFWAEGGTWETPGCFDATAAGAFVGADGQDLSAWNSGTHDFTFDPAAGSLTIIGGFIGIPKAANGAEVTVPQTTVTYTVVKLVNAEVDTMVLETVSGDGVIWRSTLVSYDNPSDKVIVEECAPIESVNVTFKVDMSEYTGTGLIPEVNGTFNSWCGNCNAMTDDDSDGVWEVTLELPVGDHEYKFSADSWADEEALTPESSCTITTEGNTNRTLTVGIEDMTLSPVCWNSCDICGGTPAPTTLGHTFADAAGANYFTKFQGASTITLGVADPAGGTGLVGQFNRVATAYQEAILSADPQANFLLSNVTTMTIEVYLPSTNDHSGALTKGLVIGFGDQTEGGNWWEYQAQWSADDLALDQWHPLTFDLTAPTSGNTEDATKRADLDMFFLGIGGGNHTVEGTFYIRNLEIK